MQSSDDIVDIGEEHHRAGRSQEAEFYYRKALEIDPGHPGALYFLANIAYDDGRLPLALQLAEYLLRNEPNDAEAWHLLGMIALKEEKLDRSVEFLTKALAIAPAYVQACLNLGTVLRRKGELHAALLNYDKALSLEPGNAEAHFYRGMVLRDLNCLDKAVASYNKAIEIKPDHAAAYLDRGIALKDLGRLDEALASYDRAIELKPDFAEVYVNRGNALKELGRLDETLAAYDRAIELKPDFAEVYVNRGNALKEVLKPDAARTDFEKALQLKPDYCLARWNLGLVDILPFYSSQDEVEKSREAFGRSLTSLDEWFDSSKISSAEEAVSATLPFYLAYQEKNNRDLLSRYGRLAGRLMKHWQTANGLNPKSLVCGEKIKVGVVSRHVRDHSVWQAIVKGWLLNFDSSRFEWHVFNLGSRSDEQTGLARNKATSFAENAGSLKEWASRIVESRMEVLIYPEIGMNPLTAKLASLRLAPLQIAAWGHPETTGLETMDYYLSADLLEPDDADSNYTESLVKLPNLGCTYTPYQVMHGSVDLAGLGISEELPILLCPGITFKYLPKHDGVFPEVARLLGKCTFVFFDHAPYWTALLKYRLETAFQNENLEMNDFVKFIPWLNRESFFALMKRADVFMDTIGFSGFNTAIQAIECSLPVVTIDGRFMRGRLASGILKRLGLDELICDSERTYCDVVERLVKDKSFRARIISGIDSRRAILYGDMEPQRALEEFLIAKCRPV